LDETSDGSRLGAQNRIEYIDAAWPQEFNPQENALDIAADERHPFFDFFRDSRRDVADMQIGGDRLTGCFVE